MNQIMSIIEKAKSEITEKSEEENNDEIYYRVYPDMRRRIDYHDRKVHIEVSLPGVAKSDVSLKALPTWFSLSGKRGHMEYSANKSFGVKIVPEKTEAKYENGLLNITAYMENPMDHAKTIDL